MFGFLCDRLLLIVEQMLMSCVMYRDQPDPPQPYIPGSILDTQLVFPREVVLCEWRLAVDLRTSL